MKVIKRNGEEVLFNPQKIENAILKADKETVEESISSEDVHKISKRVERKCKKLKRSPRIEEIQEMVIDTLFEFRYFKIAKNYITYRYEHELLRKSNSTDKTILSILSQSNEDIIQENSNKDPMVVTVMRDYVAGEVSKDLVKRFILPNDIWKAHEEGIIHFHDADYAMQPITNCCLVNLEDMLQNGTVINGTCIDKPKSFLTACTIASQVSACVSSSQFGGQTMTASHLAPFVNVSRQKYRQQVKEELQMAGFTYFEPEQVNEIAEMRTRKEIKDGIQTFMYQVNSIMGSNGQSPFITFVLDINEVLEGQIQDDLALIIEEVLEQRILGMKNEKGVYISVAFPKLIYVLDENNIYPDSKYYYLTELSARCTAKRLVPDYVSAKKMRELKGDVYCPMGCRSFLTPDRFTGNKIGNIAKAKNYVEGQHKYYGRFNNGVVTINLVDVACSAYGNETEFWKILEERLDMCHRALKIRHERLRGVKSDVAPILWQQGALARLDKGEEITPLLFDGYSTISLGYAGLYECIWRMREVPITEPEGHDLAVKIMQKLNDKCNQWKAQENIDYSVYGTPIESCTYKFAKCLQRRFGIIENVTDKNYITNSYHVKVTQPINAFDKLTFEAELQALSPGGAISYVETPNMQNNIPAVLAVIRHIYDNIIYAELNTKSDYCQKCGYDGEIQIVKDEHGKYIWECPNCKNTDRRYLNITRRVCGYLSTNDFNQGRTQEIKDRILHL